MGIGSRSSSDNSDRSERSKLGIYGYGAKIGAALHQLRVWLLSWPRQYKQLLLVLNDIAILMIALWASLSLAFGAPFVPRDWTPNSFMIVAPFLAAITFHFCGSYRRVTRYIDTLWLVRINFAIFVAIVCVMISLYTAGEFNLPISFFVMFWLISAILITSSRTVAGAFLRGSSYAQKTRNFVPTKVVIYGAGTAGIQLLRALNGSKYLPVGFIDDNKSLWGQKVAGLKVFPPQKIDYLLETREIKQILLDITGNSRGIVANEFSESHSEERAIDNSNALKPSTLAAMEREMIKQTLNKFAGSRRKTARALQISERTLYRKIKDYGL